MYDIIIIGAGVSGIQASIYSTVRGKNVLVIEKNEVGGILSRVSTVTHLLSVSENETGKSFQQKLLDQVKKYNINIKYEEVIEVSLDNDIKVVKTNNNIYKTNKLIIACGTNKKRLWASCEGRYFGNGSRMNAYLDYKKYINKEVVVTGSSDGAVKEALFLSQYVKHIHLVTNESQINAIKEFKDKLEKLKNISYYFNSKVTKFIGDDNKLDAIEITNLKTNKQTVIEKEGIGEFTYIGQAPNTYLFPFLKLDNGYIITNEFGQTNIPGIYACGDIIKKNIRQAANAISEGMICAVEACK